MEGGKNTDGILSTKRTRQVRRLVGLSRRKAKLSSVSRILRSLTSGGSRREVLVFEVRHCERLCAPQVKYTADLNRSTRCYSFDRMMVPVHKMLRDTLGNHVRLAGRHASGNCLESELAESGHCEFAMLVLCCSSNPTELCPLVDKPLGN